MNAEKKCPACGENCDSIFLIDGQYMCSECQEEYESEMMDMEYKCDYDDYYF